MMDLTGSRLGQYRIIEKLGHGASADVYKAWHAPAGRYVALKILTARPEMTDDKTVQRFQQEALAASNLHHPNIVQVYDAGFANGYYYIAMEYLEGGTLAYLMQQGLNQTTALAILLQIASALDFAHRNGIVAHRDVKPSNVLLTRDRHIAKLSDFGIAVLSQSAILVSSGSSNIGTPAYMAPEQLLSGQHVDARSDVYAFGTMMYEIFTGRLPFVADNPFVLGMMKLTQTPPLPSQLNPTLDGQIAQVIWKCIQPHPEDRCQNTFELLQALAFLQECLRPASSVASETEILQLFQMLVDLNPVIKGHAQKRLIGLGPAAVEVAFRKGFGDEYAQDRSPLDLADEAARVIRMMGPQVIERLASAIEHGRSQLYTATYTVSIGSTTFSSATGILASFGKPAVLPFLSAIGKVSDTVTKLCILTDLCFLDQGAYEFLREVVLHSRPYSDLWLNAVLGLGNIGDAWASNMLLSIARSRLRWSYRLEAISGLNKIGDARSAGVLLEVLDEALRTEQLEMIKVKIQMIPISILGAIQQRIRFFQRWAIAYPGRDFTLGEIITTTIQTLGEVGDQRAFPLLHRIAAKHTGERRAEAFAAIRKIAQRTAINGKEPRR